MVKRTKTFTLMAAFAILFALATLSNASPITTTSPVNGGTALPAGVTEVGGVVLHIKGVNGTIVTSQLAASSLFSGFFNSGSPAGYQGNPGTIGIQTGFSPAVTNALGGGIAELAVRVTLADGDTAVGDFDYNRNFLLLNGVNFGSASNFSNVTTQETSSDGLTNYGSPSNGFNDTQLRTGFFYFTNAGDLATLFASIVANQQVVIQLADTDPYDNLFNFTAGVDGGLINVGQGPTVDAEVPEPASLALWGICSLGAAWGARRIRKQAKPGNGTA